MNKQEFIKFLEKNNIRREITEEDGKIKVGGFLNLSNTKITKLPDNLTVGGWLDLSNTNITELPDNLTVGGWLDLSSTNITKLPDNLTVGGSLDLSNTKITKLPDNLTVGRSLDLSDTNITELPNNLMVDRNIYGFNGDRIASIKKVSKGYNERRNYIYFDNILWGNIKSIKKRKNITIYKTPLGYCVEEDNLTAHGKTLKEALDDLKFKKLQDIDVQEIVAEINKTKKVTKAQYRAITGACRMGTEGFCRQHNIIAEEISLDELRKILINDYGAEKFWSLIDGDD